jgi:enterochelin esterase-like enzyme
MSYSARRLFPYLFLSLGLVLSTAASPSALTPCRPGRVAPAQDSADDGQALEGLHLTSSILGRDVRYTVYLPPDYQASTRRYPVVYLLHGLTGNETDWIQFGEIPFAADRAIADGSIPPLIIVMPDGGNLFYMNDYQNKVRYEDMFVEEFVPHIDGTLRTRPDREFRGIAGLSMGGWGSLLLSLRHPDLFSACAAFSSAVFTDEDLMAMDQEFYDRFFVPLFGPPAAGKDRRTEQFRKYNPLDLAKTLPVEALKKVRLYVDCGDDDFLIKGNAALHIVLADRKIPHEFRVRDGAHTWTYWRTGIVDGLKFISQGFIR